MSNGRLIWRTVAMAMVGLAACSGGSTTSPLSAGDDGPGSRDAGSVSMPDGGAGGGTPDGGAGGWVQVRPDEAFRDIRALGGDLYGVGYSLTTSEHHVEHRQADGTWRDLVLSGSAVDAGGSLELGRIAPLAADEFYAYATAASGGGVYHYGGGVWTLIPPYDPAHSPSYDFFLGAGSTAYLGVAYGGVQTSTAGGSLSFLPFPGCVSFVSGFASPTVRVFASENGRCQPDVGPILWVSTGGDYSSFQFPTAHAAAAIVAFSATDIYAGWINSVGHFDGAHWQDDGLFGNGGSFDVVGLAASSPSDIWALTSNNWVFHFDGHRDETGTGFWKGEPLPSPVGNEGRIAVTGPGDVWVLANDRLYHRR